MSFFGDLIKEKFGTEIFEDEHGFFTYLKIGKIFYSEEIYIRPESRSKGILESYRQKATELAKQMDCEEIMGKVDIKSKTSERAVGILLSQGYKFLRIHDNHVIYFSRKV